MSSAWHALVRVSMFMADSERHAYEDEGMPPDGDSDLQPIDKSVPAFPHRAILGGVRQAVTQQGLASIWAGVRTGFRQPFLSSQAE